MSLSTIPMTNHPTLIRILKMGHMACMFVSGNKIPFVLYSLSCNLSGCYTHYVWLVYLYVFNKSSNIIKNTKFFLVSYSHDQLANFSQDCYDGACSRGPVHYVHVCFRSFKAQDASSINFI